MLETGKPLRKTHSRAARLLIGVALVTGIGAIWYLESGPRPSQVPQQIVLTEEARAYLPHLDLGEVEMSAKDNALGQTLVEITGKIGNSGERQVSSIRINCVFFDVNGIELHRVLSTIVHSRQGLAPASVQEFRLPFDSIPDGWNQIMPSLYIAEIVFE